MPNEVKLLPCGITKEDISWLKREIWGRRHAGDEDDAQHLERMYNALLTRPTTVVTDEVVELPTQSHPMGCCSAAIAGLLGLPLSEVPDFWTERQFGDVRDWLAGRGLCLQELMHERLWDGRYLGAGKSPRGNPHFVIYEDGKIVHDPHPEGGGLIEVTHTWLIYPRDLASMPTVVTGGQPDI